MKKICLYLLLFTQFYSFAQSSFENSLQIPREKVYLNVNKTYYFAGEKLVFDASIVDARTLQNDTLSVPLYVELIDNQKDSLINRWILKVADGKVNTTIKIPDNLQSDYYQLRAYTNWMRNFPMEVFSRVDLLVFGKNYKDQIPKEALKSSLKNLKVYPESGICVNGLINNLYVQTLDNFGKGIKSIVSLKSDTSTIRIFDTNEVGDALVEFEPVSGKSYYLESGFLKTIIPQANDEGVILRGYYTNEGKKLSVTVQNNYKKREPLKLILQTRGNIFYNTLIEPKKIALVNLKIDSLPEGILNAALIDLEGKIVSQRVFLNAQKDRDNKENYLLFNSELNAPIEFTNRFSTDIGKVNNEMINKKNVIYGFDELQKIEKLGNNFLVHKNELGISVDGKITDDDVQRWRDPISISLVIVPEEKDTVNKKQFFAVSADKKGNFSFEDLDFYGQSTFDIKAIAGKKSFNVSLKNDAIPPIIRTNKSIDWRIFQDTSQVQTLSKNFVEVTEKIALDERMKVRELEEVVVRAKKIVQKPLSVMISEPNLRLTAPKLVNYAGRNAFQMFFDNRVAYRLQKYYLPKVKIFIDDVPIIGNQLDYLQFNTIAYIDIHDGTPECYQYNAEIILNMYTKSYNYNPLVVKIVEEEEQQGKTKSLKVQRTGYYLPTTK